MNKIFTLLLVLLWGLFLSAKPVSSEKAKLEARAFLLKKMPHAGLRSVSRTSTNELTQGGRGVAYYVYNVGKNNGFVIVSGDDRTESILGYSDKGHFDQKNIPDNMKFFLKRYQEEIQSIGKLKRISISDSHAKIKRFVAIRHNIAPLIKTVWDQGEPYWNLCPKEHGKRCLTGCVATGAAQILNYWQFPKQVGLLHGYETDGGLRVRSLKPTSFNWSLMRNDYRNSNISEESKTEVAKLMSYCGVAIHMDYSSRGSGALSSDLAKMLKTYFGYANVQYVRRDDYSMKAWDELIYNELKNSRPVGYGGATLKREGHFFVCDGYDVDGFYHINWGWSGSSNGYFRLSSLNPDGSGSGGGTIGLGFSLGDDAIIGIQPPNENNQLPKKNLLTLSSLEISELKIYNRKNQDIQIKKAALQIQNISGENFKGKLGLGLYQNDSLVKVLSMRPLMLENWTRQNRIFTNFSLGKDLSLGVYQIKAISKSSDENSWEVVLRGNKIYAEVDVYPKKIEIKSAPRNLNLNTLNFDVPTNKIAGLMQTANITLQNEGMECNGVLNLVYGGKSLGTKDIFMASKESRKISLNFIAPQAGHRELHLYFVGENSSQKEINSYNVQFKKNQNGENPVVNYLSINNASFDYDYYGVVSYGAKQKLMIKLKNNSGMNYDNEMYISMWRQKGDTQYYSLYATSPGIMVHIPSGQSKDVVYSFNNISVGANYFFEVKFSADGPWGTQSGIIRVKPGISYWDKTGAYSCLSPSGDFTAPENAVAVDVRGVHSVNAIAPNQNPNCLYYVDADRPFPGLSGKNVIKNNIAENIRLQDGFPFYAPYDFVADEISYDRTFRKGYNGVTDKNWSTLVLPFTVGKVTEGGKSVDWFHSSEEKNKNFWVASFVGEDIQGDEASVCFRHAKSIEANRPYIIAVPGERFKGKSLVNKTLRFSAAAAAISGGSKLSEKAEVYKFSGLFLPSSLKNVYALDDKGMNFGLVPGSEDLKPFRAYFRNTLLPENGSLSGFSAPRSLSIRIVSDAPSSVTSLRESKNSSSEKLRVFNLQGRQVGVASEKEFPTLWNRLEKGVYIVNGKKQIKL